MKFPCVSPIGSDREVMHSTLFDPPPPGEVDATGQPQVSSLYAAAAARIVVTSKRSFVTACGMQQLTGEVMAVDYVPRGQAASLESVVAALVGSDRPGEETGGWSAAHSSAAVFDPDVLLAWLLAEGVSARH
jgi:hypothetical protein